MRRGTTVAGYSGTPLVQKLGIKPGQRVALLNAPKDLTATLGELPEGVQLDHGFPKSKRRPDGILLFVSSRSQLQRRLPTLRTKMAPDSGLWVCWPKKASGVRTDMTEDAIRQVALPIGLVDNKVCAVNATWSGLRLVIRLELRFSGKRPTRSSAHGRVPGFISAREPKKGGTRSGLS